MATEQPCEFCGKMIAKGGAMESHVHFKHLGEVLERFRNNPVVIHFLAAERVRQGLLLPFRSATPCWVCGGDKEVVGPYGESLLPCPHCVLMLPCEERCA